MIGVTIRDNSVPGLVDVEVWEGNVHGTADLASKTVPPDELRGFVTAFVPDEIWQTGELVHFCDYPGCPELVPLGGPSGLCKACRAEQSDRRAEVGQTRYGGVAV